MSDRLPAMFRIVSALHHNREEEFVEACRALQKSQTDGRLLLQDLLRVCHLFYGFPRIVRSITLISQQLGTLQQAEKVATPKNPAELGEQLFREVYGRDADPVLQHLQRVDPTFRHWVLSHAYGTTFATTQLSLEERERLSVLALVATGCWQQARSHMRACLRHGVDKQVLLDDLVAVDWLDQEAQDLATTCIHAEALQE